MLKIHRLIFLFPRVKRKQPSRGVHLFLYYNIRYQNSTMGRHYKSLGFTSFFFRQVYAASPRKIFPGMWSDKSFFKSIVESTINYTTLKQEEKKKYRHSFPAEYFLYCSSRKILQNLVSLIGQNKT